MKLMGSIFKEKVKLVFVISIMLASSLFASTVFALASERDTVYSVRFDAGGNLIVALTGNNNGCGGQNFLINSSTTVSLDGIASLVLTALASGREIRGNYVICSDSPWANTATVGDVTLH